MHSLSGCWWLFFAAVLTVPFVASGSDGKCSLPVKQGTCDEQILRWFFDGRTKTCQTFVYTGCDGNANNFNSSMYCRHACNGTSGKTHPYLLKTDIAETLQKRNDSGLQPKATVEQKKTGTVTRSKRNVPNEEVSKEVSEVSTADNNDASVPLREGFVGKSNDISDMKDIISKLIVSINKLEKTVSGDGVTKMRKKPKIIRRKERLNDINSAEGRRRSIGIVPTPSESRESKTSSRHLTETSQFIQPKLSDTFTRDAATDEESNDEDRASSQRPNVVGRAAGEGDGEGDEDEEGRRMLDSKIRNIIGDPSYVFSCQNISAQDMAVLKEAVLELDADALRLMPASSESKGDDRRAK